MRGEGEGGGEGEGRGVSWGEEGEGGLLGGEGWSPGGRGVVSWGGGGEGWVAATCLGQTALGQFDLFRPDLFSKGIDLFRPDNAALGQRVGGGGAPNCEAPKGGGLAGWEPRPRKSGGPEGWSPEGWGPEGPSAGPPKISFFFSLSPATIFFLSSLSLGGPFVEFWWCF